MLRALLALTLWQLSGALVVCGVDIASAKLSPASRALDQMKWPDEFPFGPSDLKPMMAGNDGMFYLLPKFVQHAGDECRASLTAFYGTVLPPAGTGDVLDLCSSWTSHFPKGYKSERCAVLGLNALELLANPSKTEWTVQDLNENPTLPYGDASFDVITNSLSVDYLTQPLEVFGEMSRVLKPGGLACMAFTNRCFPTVSLATSSVPPLDRADTRPLLADTGVALFVCALVHDCFRKWCPSGRAPSPRITTRRSWARTSGSRVTSGPRLGWPTSHQMGGPASSSRWSW